ncbi:two-component system sensor histidine kinase NtrB [Azomonas macrocytogenes]|uniref:histidine kinase n=1 Tax=Azomonas macrocytogenes TaxID=69962 RepID=A0A839SZ39_AZOMA|nr:ATP-binding protein [Azomonas macrocytogenes]MBB3102412.1 two-component system sensor histidine kinase PilS (NtrC family) [Azomonas macrocytogenes]
MAIEGQLLIDDQDQRILGLYHFYRLTIALVMLLLIASGLDDDLLKMVEPTSFRQGAWLYLTTNVLSALLVRQPRYELQLFILALLDILLLLMLFYFAGGTPSGIGNLVVVAVAIASILLNQRIGLLIAAIASLGLIYLTFYLQLVYPAASHQYVPAGVLGALCFGSVLLIQTLSRRLRISENLARQRGEAVASLEALNALILQRMRTGILVLDSRHRVLMANQGALNLLGQADLPGKHLDQRCSRLIERLDQWRQNPSRRPDSLELTPNGPTIQPSFTPLQHGEQKNILIFLEDLFLVAQQAQQMKLASLGRLTASIAHEIRNPLGAISHAAQLLHESESLDKPDRRLAQIIQEHSQRMNSIIENVLQLSRRRQAAPQLLNLEYSLTQFTNDLQSRLGPQQTLHLEIIDNSLQTRMDPNQLVQILYNLVQNGLRYSGQLHEQAQTWLKLHRDPDSDLPILEVLDDGPGIAAEKLQHIFEPFFTTDINGTGLGLYLCRELCESNQARIDYQDRTNGGSCFRIIFAHPDKRG